MTLADALLAAGTEPELAFPRAEYDRRLAAVRRLMAQRGLDLLVISNTSNIGYLTGFDTAMPPAYSVLVVARDGEPVLHCAEVEVACMLRSGWVREIEVFDWYAAADTGSDLARVVGDRHWHTGAIGVEMGFAESFASGAFDARSFQTLSSALPRAAFEDATDLVLEARLVKSPLEIDCMRRAAEYTRAGIQAALAAVREGATDNDVAAAAYQATVAAGSELMSIDPIVIGGERTGWMPHLGYRRVPLMSGDPVYLEMSGVHNRYAAPCMRSAVVGSPSRDVERLAEAAIATVELLLAEIAPGRSAHDVARAAAPGLADVPDAYFHGAYAYSIGLGFQPSWTENPLYIAEGVELELQPGMTFHLPLDIWIPARCGVGFSESVVVTEDGCERLTTGPERRLVTSADTEQARA